MARELTVPGPGDNWPASGAPGTDDAGAGGGERRAFWARDLGTRRAIMRAVFVILLAAGAIAVYLSATGTLAGRGIGTGFGFLWQEAGVSIGEVPPLPVLSGPAAPFILALVVAALLTFAVRLALPPRGTSAQFTGLLAILFAAMAVVIALVHPASVGVFTYEPSDTFALAMVTGFGNTVKVSIFAILGASVLGVAVGLGRLSTNWLVSRSSTLFVETIRNIPLLIQVFFWYFGVLRALPGVRQSIDVGGIVLNNRGLYIPRPEATAATLPMLGILAASLVLVLVLRPVALRVRIATGERARWWRPILALPLVLIAGAWLAYGLPFELERPVRAGFNYTGGLGLTPEFAALLIALTLYGASFIAEIVRGAIQGVDPGQREAARALGLHDREILRLVVFPQALRVMFPPLITQYLSLIKDSSLGFAIAYPELVSINNVMINQTGQPIEILCVTISVFLILNLGVSLILNRFDRQQKWQVA